MEYTVTYNKPIEAKVKVSTEGNLIIFESMVRESLVRIEVNYIFSLNVDDKGVVYIVNLNDYKGICKYKANNIDDVYRIVNNQLKHYMSCDDIPMSVLLQSEFI